MAFWKVITLAFATSIIAEARWNQHQKREIASSICDPVYNNTKNIQCYCVMDHSAATVRSANCHMAKKDVKPEDKSWNSFEALRRLNHLTLSNTRGIALTYIPTHALNILQQLMKLDIKYGNIEIINAFAFANLSVIEEITLSDNQIKILGENAFAHHRDLVSISLDSNNIVEINRDVFVNLPSLEKLFLTNNKITTIHDRAFVHLTNLRELEIDRNSIFTLNSETFSGLKKLQKLDLSGNSLEVIGDNTFLPLINLKSLNLEQNKIQMIDEKAFKGLGNLNALSLAHNKLITIDNVKTFEGMEALTMLSLKSNQLIELSPQVMEPILNNFYGNSSTLDVEDNNFPCDCRLDWFVKLMNKTQNSHLRLATENLKCVPDVNLRELWAKTDDTEKSGGQVFEDEESQVQNTDYEYYDESQLNGKLFYIDVRDLANCTNTSRRVAIKKNDIKKTQPVAIETTTKLTTKVISSPTTTHKPTSKPTMQTTPTPTPTPPPTPTPTQTPTPTTAPTTKLTPSTKEEFIIQTTKATTVAPLVETSKMNTEKTKAPNKENETKPKESFTTVRLATVSAKPIESNIYDHDMASDEARPERIKAHRSIQGEMKDTPQMNYNDAGRNVNSVALVGMIICFRLYFY